MIAIQNHHFHYSNIFITEWNFLNHKFNIVTDDLSRQGIDLNRYFIIQNYIIFSEQVIHDAVVKDDAIEIETRYGTVKQNTSTL